MIHAHPLIFEHQLGDVLRVEAIDIFGGIDGEDDGGFFDVGRGKGLHEDTVDGGVGIKAGAGRR